MDKLLGATLKNLRKSNNMTLQELSDRSELSVSYLSMLERCLSSPTIANLQKICNVFDIMLPELLSKLDAGSLLVKKADRKLIFEDEIGVRYEALTDGPSTMTGLIMIVTDNHIHLSDLHASDELGYMISGRMDMTVDNVTYHLEEGDSLCIPAFTKHNFEKTSDCDCVSIWSYPVSKAGSHTHGNNLKI